MKVLLTVLTTLTIFSQAYADYAELRVSFKADNETAAFTNSPFVPQNSKIPLMNRIDFIKDSSKLKGEIIYSLKIGEKIYRKVENQNVLHYFANKFFEIFGDNKIYFLHSINSPPFSFLPAEILRFDDFYIKSFNVRAKDWESFVESAHPFPQLREKNRQNYILTMLKELGFTAKAIEDYTYLDYYSASSKFGLVCESQRNNQQQLNINYYCKHDVDFSYSLQFKIIY